MPRPPRPAAAPGTLGRDLPPPLGVDPASRAAPTFAVYAGHADGVEVCLFDAGDADGATERRVAARRAGPRHVVRLRARRAARASATACGSHGPWEPGRGACGTTRPSCCSTPTPGPSRARSPGRPEVFGHGVDDRPARRRRRSATTATARGATCRAASSSTTASTGATTRRPHAPVAETRHLRGARAQPDRAAPRRARGAARHVCRAGPPGRRSTHLTRPRRHRRSSCCRCTPSRTSRTWPGAG